MSEEVRIILATRRWQVELHIHMQYTCILYSILYLRSDIYGRMPLGLSTTLVWDSGFHVGDCNWTESSMWETPSKSRRLNHPLVTADLFFRNFSPAAHVGTLFPTVVVSRYCNVPWLSTGRSPLGKQYYNRASCPFHVVL